MPAWDQQELKVHPRYQLDPSPAVVITTQFATSEESAKTSKVAVIKLYQWQRPVFTSSAQITSSSERSPLAFAAVFINHINVNWNQFCPATPPLPQLTNQKLYFSGRYSPHPLPIPLPNTQNKPHRFPGTARIFSLFLRFLIFSSFFHVFLGRGGGQMNTNTWARPIVIPWDASPISHANRALRRLAATLPIYFLSNNDASSP